MFANLEEKFVIVLLHLVWRRPENNSLLALLPRDVNEIRDYTQATITGMVKSRGKNVHSTFRYGYIIRGPGRGSLFFLLLGQTSPVKYVLSKFRVRKYAKLLLLLLMCFNVEEKLR